MPNEKNLPIDPFGLSLLLGYGYKTTTPAYISPRPKEQKVEMEALGKFIIPPQPEKEEQLVSLPTKQPVIQPPLISPEQQRQIEEAQKKIQDLQGRLKFLRGEVAKLVSPAEPTGISAASLGKLIETEMKPISEAFQKFSTDLATMQEMIGGEMRNVLELHKTELEARKTAIERQYLEQKQALETAEGEARERLERGWERLGLRNIIIGRQLEELTTEEGRVSAEFAKAHSMLDMAKEEALTQALATQRQEDWNRLSIIMNTKMNLLNQQMNLWQTFQNTKLALRQQFLSEFLATEQFKETKKTSALENLNLVLTPYVGRGISFYELPQDIQRIVREAADITGLPLEDVVDQLVSTRDRQLELKKAGNQMWLWDKRTGEILQQFNLPQTVPALPKAVILNQIIDMVSSIRREDWLRKYPNMFLTTPEKEVFFRDVTSFKRFVEAMAKEIGTDVNDVLARLNPEFHVVEPTEEEEKKRYDELINDYKKAAGLVILRPTAFDHSELARIFEQYAEQ